MGDSFFEEKEGISTKHVPINILNLLNSQTMVPIIAFTCVYDKGNFGSNNNHTSFKLFCHWHISFVNAKIFIKYKNGTYRQFV